jgi:hypothetical protein
VTASASFFEFPPDNRTPEERTAQQAEQERNRREYRERERDERRKQMLDDSIALERLIDRNVVQVSRTFAQSDYEWESELVVEIRLDDGTTVRLRGMSYDYDGDDPGIRAEVVAA